MTSIVSTGDSHVTFARALACPDKEVRDKTVVSLINYVAGLQNITEMEMLKLWKALYYCMWLSDKALIQMELAQALTGLFNSFKERDFAVLYFGIFFRTMVREWTLLDQHRINKFYTLIRLMLREGLSSMHKNGWTAESMDSLLDALEEEVLVKTPNGIRLHIADIFLEELMIVTKGDINTDAFVRALRPFFGAVQGCLDTSFQERVSNKIFSAFVKTFAREHKGSTEDEMLFLKVKTTVIQGMIFSIASDSDTADKNRRKLYLLHQEFPEVTGQPFVSFEEEEDEEEEIVMSIHNGSEARSSSGKSDVVAIKTKETQKQEAGEDLPLKKSKKRKADSEVPEPQQIQRKKEVNLKTPIISLEAVPAATKIEHKKIVVDAVPTVVKSKPTQKTDAPLPVANMIAVPSAATKATAVEATAPFIKSQRFTGGMLGYIFKKVISHASFFANLFECAKLRFF